MTTRVLLPAIVAALYFTASPASACPFCSPAGTTLVGEVAQADFIVYGTLSNAKQDSNDFTKGTTDLTIDVVIKPHDAIKGKKTITIPRYIPPVDGKDYKHLIFFNVINGQLDPYRGDAFPMDSKLPGYLKGALDVRQKDVATRLRYFFDYLESPDVVISSDAYNEFAVADYKEIESVAPKLPADLLIKWLKDPNTRGSRFGLYGLMLGHCGKASDAKAIRELLDDKDRSYSSGLDGVLTGYVMLNHKDGWDYLLGLVNNPEKEFPVKYAALRTARFFWEFRPDVIPHAQVLAVVKQLMDNPDIADMPMEDLRKWKAWENTSTVLAYDKKPSHNSIPIIRRAILKFAIAASWANPKNKEAVDFVNAAKAADPKRVEFLEELLKDELKPMKPDVATTPKTVPPKTGG